MLIVWRPEHGWGLSWCLKICSRRLQLLSAASVVLAGSSPLGQSLRMSRPQTCHKIFMEALKPVEAHSERPPHLAGLPAVRLRQTFEHEWLQQCVEGLALEKSSPDLTDCKCIEKHIRMALMRWAQQCKCSEMYLNIFKWPINDLNVIRM